MKTLESIFALLVTTIAVFSCSGSGMPGDCRPVESLCVAIQSDFSSRIELGTGFETLLNTDDVFSVFHKSPANEIWFYDGADKVTSGEIKHISDGKRDEIYPHIAAVSPFNALNSLSYCGGVSYRIQTVIPPSQTYADGGFDPLAAIMVACDESGPLHFKYACGFVELDLEGPAEISSIVLKGNDGEFLSGDVCIGMDGSDPFISGSATVDSVVVRCPGAEGFSITGKAKILFSVVPQIFSKGVTYVIGYESGRTQTVTVTSPVTVSRGGISPAHKAVCRDYSVLDVCFLSPSGETFCPFKTEISRNIIPVGASGTTAESAPVYLLGDSDELYPFSFYIRDVSASDNLRITKSGLNIGGSIGDYMKFPGIEGRRLSRVDVSLTDGKTGAAFCICGQDDRRLSDDVSSNTGAAYGIRLQGALEGESVKMVLRREAHCFIHSIRLRYE